MAIVSEADDAGAVDWLSIAPQDWPPSGPVLMRAIMPLRQNTVAGYLAVIGAPAGLLVRPPVNSRPGGHSMAIIALSRRLLSAASRASTSGRPTLRPDAACKYILTNLHTFCFPTSKVADALGERYVEELNI